MGWQTENTTKCDRFLPVLFDQIYNMNICFYNEKATFYYYVVLQTGQMALFI